VKTSLLTGGELLVKRIGRSAVDWVDLQHSLILASLREVAPMARGNLLDVGCGEKPYEDIFLPYVQSYVGVEHEGAFNATSASARGKPDVLYSGSRLPFDDGAFDTVLSVQVLEHTPRPSELLREMARVLRPGGLLILMAPFSFRLHEEPHDYYRYTPHGLRELCQRVGLDVTDVRAQGNLWSLLGHKLNTYLAFRVARIGQVAQELGKLGHEGAVKNRPRFWTLPAVVPAMFSVSLSARILDRIGREPTETLGYLVLASRVPGPLPDLGVPPL
jgi:SAM-dependent methyltransferase